MAKLTQMLGGKKSRAQYNMYAADEMGEGRKPKSYAEWSNPQKPQQKKLSDVVTGN